MNAGYRASFAHTDSERIEQILEILPEVDVREFTNELVHGARYHAHYNQKLSEYEEKIIKSKVFAFADPELNNRYKEFNLVVIALDFMLTNHFFSHQERPIRTLSGRWEYGDSRVKKITQR